MRDRLRFESDLTQLLLSMSGSLETSKLRMRLKKTFANELIYPPARQAFRSQILMAILFRYLR